jgi:hypothetical protein
VCENAFRGEREARFARQHAAVRLELGEQRRVIGRIDDDADVAPVLGPPNAPSPAPRCRCSRSPRPAYSPAFATVSRKRIEIYHDKVDRRNRMFFERCAMSGILASRENATVHFRMQRLHAPIEHFGKAV